VPFGFGDYQMIDVASDDVLNGRAEPRPSAEIYLAFAPGQVINIQDSGVRLSSGTAWVPYSPDGHVVGWMNARFLERVTDTEMAGCFEWEPTLRGGCERIIVTYGGVDSITPVTATIDNQLEHATTRLGKETFDKYWDGEGPATYTETRSPVSGDPVLTTRLENRQLAVEVLASSIRSFTLTVPRKLATLARSCLDGCRVASR
jgi:hypothetical protein